MRKTFFILVFFIAPFVSKGQGCNGVTLLELIFIYPSYHAEFDWNYYCCSQGISDIVIYWGDGTCDSWNYGSGGCSSSSIHSHNYNAPVGTYYVTGSFYCAADSTTYYTDSIEVVIECPSTANQSYWEWMPHYYTDSIVEELNWDFWETLDIIIDSIDWGDGSSTNFEDTILHNSGWLAGTFYHNYGTSLDTSYTFNVSYRYLYDSSCTYNYSFHFDFPCFHVQNSGVTVYQSDKYRARFNCANPNSTKYYEWYITEYGDSVYGNGNHIVYFPDTGYVHYCKYRQSLIDSTCFSFVCDSVHINDTIPGCTIPEAVNYDPLANYNDGSCLIYGCTDPNANWLSYNPQATVDDGSCWYIVNNYFPTGWNLFSIPVHNWAHPEIALNISSYNQSCAFNLLIKDQYGSTFWPCYGVNQIGDLTPGAGYQSHINMGAWISHGGSYLNLDTTAIILNNGWGMLGYPRTSNAPIDSMLTDILPNVIIIKDDQGGVYWTQFGVNQIDSLRTFEGYQIKMSQSDTLFYPAN